MTDMAPDGASDRLILQAEGWMIANGQVPDFYTGEERFLIPEVRPLDLSTVGEPGLRHAGLCFYRGAGIVRAVEPRVWSFEANGITFCAEGPPPPIVEPEGELAGAFSLSVARESLIRRARTIGVREMRVIVREIHSSTRTMTGMRLMENQRARPGRSLPSLESLLEFVTHRAKPEPVPSTQRHRSATLAESYLITCDVLMKN